MTSFIPVVWLIVIVGLALVIVVGALIGWERYRGGGGSVSGSGARPTAEVFIDPVTGRRMRVWFDDRSGQREYRPE